MVSNKSLRVILGWFFLSLFLLSFLGGEITVVFGAEEDEEDNFTILPNHRWENLTTTTGTNEQLLGDYYEFNSTTSADFAKGRKLNSRDFYFETLFQVDIGTNAGDEYWEDVKGNKADFNDGTQEGWTPNSGTTQLSVNNGWLNCSLSSSDSDINIRCDSLSINSSIYKWMKFEFRVQSPTYLDAITVYDFEPLPPDQVGLDGSNRYNGTYTFVKNLDSDADWSGTETGLALLFSFSSSSVNHKIDINFTTLYSDVYTNKYLDGFKYSLLNEDEQEGMYFQFSRDLNVSNYYNLSIDMYGTNSIALSYDKLFYYNHSTDGWLYLSVEWNLDKKEIKVEFTYENRSKILKTRLITDLYSSIGTTPLRLLDLGFPTLMLNNTLSETDNRDIFSYVLLDYIDADWDLVEWREPASPYSHPTWGSLTNSLDTYFSAISPYGISVYEKNVSGRYKFYSLNVDRLDGLSFDLNAETAGLDATGTGDHLSFSIEMFNVQPNGTLLRHFTIELYTHYGGSIGTACNLYNATNDEIQRSYVNAKEDWTFDYSFFWESPEKVVLQYHFTTDTSIDVKRTYASGPEFPSDTFTREFLFVICYGSKTSEGGATDDIVDLQMGGLDLTRKDIIKDFVGLVFGTFVAIIVFFLTPIIVFFQWLVTQFLRGLVVLGDFLEPILGSIVSILEPAIGLVQSAIQGLWDFLWDLAEDAGQFFYDVLLLLLPLLLDLLAEFANIIAGLIFWIWNFGGNPGDGLPNFLSWLELLLDYIIAFVQWAYDTAVDVLQLFIDLSWVILVGWWFWAVFIQFARANGNPMEGLANFIDAYFTPLINLIFFPIPQGIVATLWLILLLPNDFFFFTMMG